MTDRAPTTDSEAVGDLDRAWNDAYERNDRAQLGDILADDFEAVAADGQRISKAQLMQPGSAPRSIAFSERYIRLFDSTSDSRRRPRRARPTRRPAGRSPERSALPKHDRQRRFLCQL